jgi:hypothetical protein
MHNNSIHNEHTASDSVVSEELRKQQIGSVCALKSVCTENLWIFDFCNFLTFIVVVGYISPLHKKRAKFRRFERLYKFCKNYIKVCENINAYSLLYQSTVG